MNKRIQKTFALLKQQHRIAFMPFLVAGDPDLKTSLKIAKVVASHADFLEIGFPFSDSIADGLVIQAANKRSLSAGVNSDKVFVFLKRLRNFTEIPISILVYSNLVMQYDLEKFYAKAKKAGVDAVLIPDLPVEEAKLYFKAARRYGLDQIMLVAQTTTRSRMHKILGYALGYVYAISILGVTGARKQISPATLKLVSRVKHQTNLPIVVGFGISNAKQISNLKQRGVDGYIIGSALIDFINKHRTKPKFYDDLRSYLKSLKI